MNETPQLIDTDVHNELGHPEELLPYLSKAWHKQWLAIGNGVGSPYYSSVGVLRRDAIPGEGLVAGSDPQFMLKDHLDRYNIDYAILTGGKVLAVSLFIDPDYANAIVAAHNDWQVETWLKASKRYKGSIFINHSDPFAAAREIDRMGGHTDLVQVIMCSGSRIPFGQRFYHPIYEAAERNGLPVAIHPGTEGRGIAGPPTPSGYPTRYMEYHNILPTNYMTHVNSLVCEGVFEKFPKLKFVGIEGGVGWLPHLMWRMDKNYKALRDSVPWMKKLPSEYIRGHIRLTTQPIEEPNKLEHLVQIFQMCGAEDMVMFSSDYPHWDFDNPHMVMSPFPKEIRAKLKALNAIDLYNLHSRPLSEKEG